MSKKVDISYKQELYRKGIHLTSLSIPIGYVFIEQDVALGIIIPLAVIAVVIDFMSKRNPIIHQLLYGYFGKMLRPHERKKFVLNGASWVLISAVICIIFFPKIVMVTSFTILIISDLTAALIGRKYGKRPFLDKSLVGTSAFIVSAFIVCSIIGFFSDSPVSYYIVAYFASIVGGIVEAASKRLMVDDNLSIPISIGIILWIGSIFTDSFGFESFINII